MEQRAPRTAEEKEADELETAKVREEEKRRQEKREAEIAASWTKRVLVEGTGPTAARGNRATIHVTARASTRHRSARAEAAGMQQSGAVFEDSRERGVPLMLLLGRGLLVPGLDRAVLQMREGERCVRTARSRPLVPPGCGAHSPSHPLAPQGGSDRGA